MLLKRIALAGATSFALAGAAAPSVGAQSMTPTDPVIQRIWNLGMDSSHVQRLSQILFDSLGPRLMGAPDLKRANDWLVATYKSWGIDAKNEQYGTWRGWRRGYSHIDLISPRVRTLDATMVGYSPGTGGKDVIAEPVILPAFKDSASFVNWLPMAKGKLVFVDAPHLTCRPAADWRENATVASLARKDSMDAVIASEWGGGRGGDPALVAARTRVSGRAGSAADSAKVAAADAAAAAAGGGRGGRGGGGGGGGGGRGGNAEADSLLRVAMRTSPAARHAQLLAMAGRGAGTGVRGTGLSLALGGGALGMFLEEAGVAGILTSRPKDAWATREIFETYNTIAPAISLSCEDYGLVYRLTENKQSPKIRMNLDAELLGEQPVFNTIATIKGTQLPNEYVMMSAHFDSWDGSSGATDNGTGTMTMMEALRILKKVYPNPKRTILVGHWSGEEEGEVGSNAFAFDHPEVIKGLQGLFNQDNGTGRVQSINPGGLPDGGNHLLRWLDKMPLEFRAQVNFNGGKGNPAGSGSDDFSFSCYMAPIFGMSARAWDYNTITWHTGHDTYDKIVFDDLTGNATMAAMLVYLASEDPTFINRDTSLVATTREADPVVLAMRQKLQPVDQPAAGRGGRGGGGGGGGGGGRGAGRGVGGRGTDSLTAVVAAANAAAGRGAGAGAGRGGGRGGGGFPTCAAPRRMTQPRIR
jgi:hypothetical protein